MTDYSDLIGVPFEWKARGPDSYDCYGLLMECWRRVHGEEIPDYTSPTDAARIAIMFNEGLSDWTETDVRPGVAVLFRAGGYVHVGMMISRDKFIHTWKKSGGVCVERFDDQWERRMIGAYEFAGAKQDV